VRVQAGGERRDADLPGEGADETTGHAALRRDADPRRPVAGGVVHPAGRHDAEDLANHRLRYDPVAGARVDAPVRERRGHDGEVAGGDQQRALACVARDDGLRVLGEDVVAAEHVRDRVVAVRGLQLRRVHRLVDLEPTAGEGGQTVDHSSCPLLRAQSCGADERVCRESSGVDHGVERASRAFQRQLVERLSGRFDTDLGQDGGEAPVGKGECVGEGLGDRLDRELDVGVAGAVDLAVDRGEHRSEPIGGRGRELRDVLRRGTGRVRCHGGERLGQVVRNW